MSEFAWRDVSRETAERLALFSGLLLRWNRTINLISRKDEPFLQTRHIADSLSIVPHLPEAFSSGIDLGSGGGFPGLILAIATGRPFTLVEADQRKASFLREAARLTNAPAIVIAQRIESLSIAPARVVTARALAPLPALLAWIFPLLTADGVAILPKGRNVDAELTEAAAQWHMRVERHASATDPAGTLLKISEISRVGRAV